jgi:hypothetical protein
VNPRQAAIRGRIGAHRLHSLHDPRTTTTKARSAFLARFEREVDPHGELSPVERERRAFHARQTYFARLALKSAQARSRRSGAGGPR